MGRTCFFIFSVVVLLLEYDSTTLSSCSTINNYHRHHHVSHNITTDQSALLALKSRIISDPHSATLTKNWSAGSSCCSWVGVICSTRHERVIALDLSYMSIMGTISPHIGNLSFLVSLVLRNNSLNGSLPEELSHLHRLKTINLRFNSFGGVLPSWFNKLYRLEELRLSYNSFTGTIPPSFSNISNLEILSLGHNPLQGNIPPEIGGLVNLELLNMQQSQLTGTIPVTIFNISTLRIIELTKNSLSGNLPRNICHGIPKILGLFLSMNKLSGSIPSALHECSKLEVMSLNYNNFSGVIPREIGNLTLLRELYLGPNDFKGTIPESVFNLSKLEVITITDTRLSGELPSTLGQKLPKLREMFLGANYLTGILSDSISNASELVVLDVGDNEFTGAIPNSVGNLGLIEWLNLGYNNYTSESISSEPSIITSLTNCRNLRKLYLSRSSLNGHLPFSIGNFSTALKELEVSFNGIKGLIPSEIGNLSSLFKLFLSEMELTGTIPKTIKGLSKLQYLDLSGNKIGGYIPDDLCKLQNLDVLDLAINQIYGSVSACLGNVTSLRELYLDSNRLTSNLPVELGNLKDLLKFHVSNNSLSGHLPPEFGELRVVMEMDLSYNQFSGDIPNIFGQLQNLINLSLSNNKLQGPIPDTFKYSISLEYMDLSNNNLSGVIPKSLEALLYLKYFNVSSNSLRGEIPSEGPFKGFTGQSFLLNKALCGAPRFQVPLCHNVHESRKNILVLLAICISSVIASVMLTYVLVFIRQRRRSKVPFQTESPIIAPRRISYHELQQATDGFDESNLLGMGSFGSVYKGILTNGTFVAIKVFNLQVEGGFKSFDVECEVLRNLRHRNIVKVISCCSNLDFKALVLEYMPNGSLEKWLYSDDHFLDILQRIDIMIDVACALDYLHYGYFMPMVHCDIKPSNVLLDEDMVAHLSDFGITKLLGEGESTAQTMTLATFGYIAPEYGTEGLVSRKCDVYSYGIMLMEIFSRTKPSDVRILGNMSLKHWINDSLPKSVIQVTDADLLKPNDGDVADKVQCVSSILKLALICSADSPDDRFNMKDVIIELKKIRLDFLANH